MKYEIKFFSCEDMVYGEEVAFVVSLLVEADNEQAACDKAKTLVDKMSDRRIEDRDWVLDISRKRAKVEVVYNPKKFGLNLTHAEMKLICKRKGNGWHISGPKKGGSNTAWFCERTSFDSVLRVDWREFRSDPLLVSMVKAGEISNKDLAITVTYDDYYIDTDWVKHEQITSDYEEKING